MEIIKDLYWGNNYSWFLIAQLSGVLLFFIAFTLKLKILYNRDTNNILIVIAFLVLFSFYMYVDYEETLSIYNSVSSYKTNKYLYKFISNRNSIKHSFIYHNIITSLILIIILVLNNIKSMKE
jgi:predicted PurR-regulated permease PerM